MSVFTLVKQQYILEPVVTFATHCFKTFGLTNNPKILYELKRRACLEPSSAFLKLHSMIDPLVRLVACGGYPIASGCMTF